MKKTKIIAGVAVHAIFITAFLCLALGYFNDREVLNRSLDYYDANQIFMLQFMFLVLCMVVIIVILILVLAKRNRMEKALKSSHAELANTFIELNETEEKLRQQHKAMLEHVQEMELLNQKYRIAVDCSDSAVWEYDITDRTVFISPNFRHIIKNGLTEKEDINHLVYDLLSEEDRILLREEFRGIQNGSKSELYIQISFVDEENNKHWTLIRGKGIKDAEGNLSVVHGILLETTKMKEQEEYISYLAQCDYLTQLPNRRTLVHRLKDELRKGNTGALILMDIDNFKDVNDTMGHAYGDRLLIEAANILLRYATEDIYVSRFGGDEFLILITNRTRKDEVAKEVQNLMHLFREPLVLDNKEYQTKFSIGVTCFPSDSTDVDQLLMNVDTAMYCAKREGKNHYIFYNDSMKDELQDKAKMEEALREAIRTDGFSLAYQPQVDVRTGKAYSYEALLRLKSGLFTPAQFIPVAENTGLIKEIGRWVAKEAIRQLKRWQAMGFELRPISINYSINQMRDKAFAEFLDSELKANQISPEFIEIEFTESILMHKTEETMEFLGVLKEIGTKIALDDFGSEYSSLKYLTFIPVDKIKLDKSLCDQFLEMENQESLRSIISLAHGLGLVVTAEGVEELVQYESLRLAKCDFIQGYLFSKPKFADDIEAEYDRNYLEMSEIGNI